jgi:hypothetical protein
MAMGSDEFSADFEIKSTAGGADECRVIRHVLAGWATSG